MKYCTNCGSPLKNNLNFCIRCNEKIQNLAKKNNKIKSKIKKNFISRYFNLKANCSICNRNLDLFSFKSRMMLRDGWLCVDCLKKAYDITKIKFNKTTLEEYKNMTISFKNNNKKKIYINIAGVTFNNESNIDIQEIFKKIVKMGIAEGYFDSYGGLSGKDLKDELYINGNVGEVANQEFPYDVLLKKENDSIKVYIQDYDDKKITHIGYIPKEEKENVEKLIDNFDYTIKAYIVGGKYKVLEDDEDEYDKDCIVVNELSYGLELVIEEK